MAGINTGNETEAREEFPIYCAICGDEIAKGNSYIFASGDCVCLACAFETDLTDAASRHLFGLEWVDTWPESESVESESDGLPYITLSEACKQMGITRDELISEVNSKAREYEGDNVDIPPEERDMYFGYAFNDVAEAHGVSPDTIVDIYNGVMHVCYESVESESVELPLDDEEIHYTNEDITEFGRLIAEIKAHGFNNEHDFYEECRTLREAGATEEDNELLTLRKKYWSMVPTPRFDGDGGNETWDAMLDQWNVDTETAKA